MKIQIQKLITHLSERGLMGVLAIGVIGLGVMYVSADVASTTLNVTINPSGGNTITVTDPNGGENWTVGNTENITWTSTGTVSDVKIEIQRTAGGSWEEVVASTTDDGSYPWVITSPTGSANTIRISEVGDAGVNDTSDATFTIAASGSSSSNPYKPQPGIDNVTPIVVINNSDAVLDITGVNFKPSATFFLDGVPLINNTWLSSTHATATVPAGIPSSMRRLYVYNGDGTYAYWGTLIKIVHQSTDGAGVNIPDIIKLYLHPNEVSKMNLTFKNYTNYTWDENLRLGTVDPQDRNSLFHNPVLWPSANRVARYSGADVLRNDEATMAVSFKAPAEVGKYTEKFGLVLEGVKWLDIAPVTVQITVLDEDEELPEPPSTDGLPGVYSAQWVSQSPYLQLKCGQTGELWVEFKNTGTLPWYSFGDNPVKLGTSHSLDRNSAFSTNGWLSNNRVALVSNPNATGLGARVVEPGEIGRFTFKVTAPANAKKYREYFRPVVEYKQWLPDFGVYWDITVTSPTGVVKTPPSTGGSPVTNFFKQIAKPKPLPVPNPTSTGTGGDFHDGIEGAIQRLFSWFGRLWN